MKLLTKHNFSLFFIFLFLFFLYFKLVFNDYVLDYDDNLLLTPLHSMNTMKDYFILLFNGLLSDFQPIRDISYLFDIQIEKWFHFSIFHSTNLILWFSICLLFYKSLSFFSNSKLNFLIMLALLFSPISVSSVAWISARKHLLACFFILLATTFSVKNRKSPSMFFSFLILIIYTLSVLSHPITLFWPLWFLIFFLNSKHSKFFKAVLIVDMCFLGFLNYKYYLGPYVYLNFGVSKIHSFDLAFSLLSLGRYFQLSFWPFGFLPTPHSEGSLQNLIGLFFLPIIIFMVTKIKSAWTKKLIFSIMPLYFFLLLPVVSIKTNIFCSDTYLLTPLVVFLFCSRSLLRNNFSTLFFLSIFVFTSIYFTWSYIPIFYNSNNIWNFSFSKEATPTSLLAVAKISTIKKNFSRADKLLKVLQEWEPNQIDLQLAVIQNIYLNESSSPQVRINRLKKIKPDNSTKSFYLALLAVNIHDSLLFYSIYNDVLSEPRRFSSDFGSRPESVLAAFSASCLYFNELDNCQKKISFLNKFIEFRSWNEVKFNSEYLRFKKLDDKIFFN